MFFGYPVTATNENWLHECLVTTVLRIHAELAAEAPESLWPEIIPAEYRETLKRRVGLRNRLRDYRAAVALLSIEQRDRVLECLMQQNRIPELCSCAENCDPLDALPNGCHESIANLFSFAFDLLTDLGVRDRQYAAIFGALPYLVCPFCGSEYFDAPGAPREDMDHYLAKTRYPFAAANLRNLIPMGMRCNERYKLAQDILHDVQGTRRCAFDPYSDRSIEVSLSESMPFEGEAGMLPRWIVHFVPHSAECDTWDAVFHIRSRIVRDVLDVSFMSWLKEFQAWIRATGGVPDDNDAVVQAIDRYAAYQSDLGYEGRAFLRAAMFRMLRDHCATGNVRLLDVMRDLVAA